MARTRWLGVATLCAAVFVGYLPALHGDFIWDDRVLLTENPMIEAPDGLSRFWLTTEAHDYWPLTSTTFWLEWRLWGLDPTGYHATNMALHAAETVLLWVVLSELGVGGAFLAALIFAVHPVNVESVAWIAQRKNLVAMLFFLLSVLSFLRSGVAEEEGSPPRAASSRRLWYWLSLAAAVLGLLGKGSVAVLPAVLLLITWWKRGRLARRDVVTIAPFALVTAVSVLVNVWFQTHGEGPIRAVTPLERLLGAGAVVRFYLFKVVAPFNPSFVYPAWSIDASDPWWWLPLAGAIGTTLVLFRSRRGWSRPFWVAWLYFCIGLVPVMGLTDVYFMKYSLVADHYQHIAIIGVLALAAAGWSAWGRRHRSGALLMAGIVAGALLALTARHSAAFQDENTLYRTAIEVNPDAWLAHYNLAVNLRATGNRREEVLHLKETLRIRPDHAKAHANLALALLEEGHLEQALVHAQDAVRLDPARLEGLVDLGIVLNRLGRAQDALAPLERAVGLRPDSAEAHHNLALTLVALGRPRDAIEHYREALRLEPDSPDSPKARKALGAALVAIGQHAEAIIELQKAVDLRPDDSEARVRLAFYLIRAGRPEEAISQYRETLSRSPEGPEAAEAHYNLGVLLTASGRAGGGLTHYREALRLRPDYADAHYNLASTLLAEGRSEAALPHLEPAVRSRPDLLPARLVLADTYARVGRLSDAVAQARATIPMASPEVRGMLQQKIHAWRAQAE